ncbi:hypothetical protein A2U01_0050047, partial [Trifolium medium]|nr:hypothetical protein [Trifolium medium]
NPTFDDAATYGSELALVQLTVNGEGISQPRMTGFDRDYDGMVDLENRAL